MADPKFAVPRLSEHMMQHAEGLADRERELAAKEAIEAAKHDGLTDLGNHRLDRLHRDAAASHALAQRVHEETAELHQRLADLLPETWWAERST
jgi:hypothetical protein